MLFIKKESYILLLIIYLIKQIILRHLMLNKKYLQRATELARFTFTNATAVNRYAALAPRTMLFGNNFGFFSNSRVLEQTSTQESFLSGTSSVYAEQMYEQWRKDPQSVHASWRIYFQNLEGGASTPFELPPTTGQDPVTMQLLNLIKSGAGASGQQSGDVTFNVQQSQKLMLLIRAYMTHGHMQADLDPLKLYETYSKDFPSYADKFKLPRTGLGHLLDYKQYGFSEADLEKEFFVDVPELAGLLQRKKNWKLRELIDAYTKAYCGKIGVEYMHISSRQKCNWIREKFEGRQFKTVSKENRILNYDRLVWANEFQKFLASKFNTTKRFGTEGCESFIAGLKVAFDSLIETGVSKVIIGMPHRGRMNVLGNVVRKPLE